ncbi:MAG: hypothetical protein P4N59_11505 [Negativicutes bacterium]|nr:hypothetical protein [Negativicutes bacterium]
MLAYQTPVDICNRALQQVGATRIVALTDDSKSAGECQFAYDKLRQSELRRNAWRFAIRQTALRPVNSLSALIGQTPSSSVPLASMLLNPPVYSTAITYPLGAIVADANGVLWQSQIPNNLGGTFGQNWVEYFGSLQVNPYDTTGQTGYYPGELVYTASGGQFSVFLALCYTQNATPGAAQAYNSAQVYYAGAVVQGSNSTLYQCLLNESVGVDPTTVPAPWVATTTYAIGAQVVATDGYVYTSKINSNTNNNPAGNSQTADWTQNSPAYWTSLFVAATGSNQWQQITAQVSPIELLYPAGTGPAWQTTTKNIFLLPNGYLRQVPQNSKAGATSFLGAPSGDQYSDWLFEGNFIVTGSSNVIVLKFIADVNEVQTFDPMFCEGLAARLGLELCEPLTQSAQKKSEIEGVYALVMREARTINGIETGATEPPEDDYIACRL